MDLELRIARVVDAQNDKAAHLQIKSCDTLLACCSHACWESVEPALRAQWNFSSVYPSSAASAPCAGCGKPVSRLADHVCYALAEMAYDEERLDVAHCVDDVDWAIICSACDKSGLEIASEALAAA